MVYKKQTEYISSIIMKLFPDY